MVVTISKRAPWNLGKQMLQIFPEPCEKCGLNIHRSHSQVVRDFCRVQRRQRVNLGKVI
ncbi:MAG: hypothetical protein AAF443_03825 [Chlamydiota bacterium]